MATDEIIFYDTPGRLAEGTSWSPNLWKTRYALNIKGLKFRVVWVEWPDIGPTLERIGATPTSTHADGRPRYTLPTIHDPNTDTIVSDSFKIARYLDETYPSGPRLFPAGTVVLQTVFTDVVESKTYGPLFFVTAHLQMSQMSPRSQEFFDKQHEKLLGKKILDLAPEGEVRQKWWMSVLAGFRQLDQFMKSQETDSPFIMGNGPCFADVVIASGLKWAQFMIEKEDSRRWEELMAADGGRWAKFLQAFRQWE